ncbi:MAG: tetratricopeptide repeat protein [Acidobacteria bacterium]|nr:tetratricopeptide repeat protein [Acidobacteriota bacterium]
MTTISLTSPLQRVLLPLGLLVLLIIAGWFIVQTATADQWINVARGDGEYDAATKLAMTDFAVQFAPQISKLHYQRGQAYLSLAAGEETQTFLKESIASLQTAAQLGPEDFRIWIALGQAQDRSGETAEAKKAFTQALKLAPNYYEPHWAYANHLLRNSENDAAFAEFKRALAIRPTELPLLFDYAWNTFNGNVAAVIKALDPSSHAKAQFASLLIERGKVNEGMALWRELNNTAPGLARSNARNLINALLTKQQFGVAYEVWQLATKTRRSDESELTEEARQEDANWYAINQPDAGSLLNNGDFENDLRTGTVAPFQIWRLTQTKGLTISRNNQQYKTGSFSLQLNFDVTGNVGFAVIEQLLPIKPATAYQLSFAAKIEDLQTLSAPLVEVYDPADLKRLHGSTKPFPLGNSAWQDHSIDFTTASATEAVVVRVLRPACGEPPCPIRGRIWLDNIKLTTK